ncbi:MAG: hypothetical protein LUE63_06230 [Lachnospiraceae bacterium]|nr:hypothetical protein [Lachnospiraceae bacterium]
MSAMLLCRSRKAKEPYFVEELGIYLYSGEELSYYIYHNAMLIGEDFLDERLFRFIGQELAMENLEGKLRKWAKQADLSELLLVILQDIHYYDSEELFAFRQTMAAAEKKTAGWRMREKADTLLARRRYSSALLQYDRLLHSGYPELTDESFRGRVWLGRGMAFARQYDWQAAASCLEKACGLLRDEDVRKKLYQITCLAPETKLAWETLAGLSAEQKAAWEAELEEAKGQSRFQGKGQDVSEWMDKDNIRRAAGLQSLVQSWKAEYRRSLGTS